MIDYKTFKKGYLTEWVDRSQAARKAAEELAMKEVKPSLRDKYNTQNVIMTLDGKQVEFKAENEKNPKDPTYNHFTYEEAMERFGEPDEDGWRLPTKEELETLKNDYPYDFKDEQGVFDWRLYLPAMGHRNCSGNVLNVGSFGWYWSSTPKDSGEAWYLCFYSDRVRMYSDLQCLGFSVRLVREVK